jgi:plasmid stabilization system protein ParE
MKVIWTKRSLESYLEIIDFLKKQWTIKEIKNFVLLTNNMIFSINKNPYIFQSFEDNIKIRKGFVHKHISLFYKINETKNVIELLVFWDNRQNPEKLEF